MTLTDHDIAIAIARISENPRATLAVRPADVRRHVAGVQCERAIAAHRAPVARAMAIVAGL